jgi:hypothetical protein
VDGESTGKRAPREPDLRALKILLDTFWSPGGWHNWPEDHVTPTDFAYAVEQGLMFEPRQITHDEAVAEAIAALGSVTPQLAASAFAFGLASRRVDLRSGLGSHAAITHLRPHEYVPWMGRGPSCEMCGLSESQDVDRNVLSFERFKWGGVRHLDVAYAAFDLEQLRLWFDASNGFDVATLERLLDRWRALGLESRVRHAADAVRGLFLSNDSERRTVVQVASVAGILQPVALPSMLQEYVPYIERDHARPGGRNDWHYPAFGWTGRDGVNEEAVGGWWGAEVARPQRVTRPPAAPASALEAAAPERPKKSPKPGPSSTAAASRMITYPLVPKSNAFLLPGQFWAIPLSDGRYACGRVLEIDRDHGTRWFLAGLMDWCGEEAPTAESISGRTILEQGEAHIRTILETGGEILGYRPMGTDGLEPLLCLSAHVGGDLQRGLQALRPATREEQERLPVLSVWGSRVISSAAEQHFVTKNVRPRLHIP